MVKHPLHTLGFEPVVSSLTALGFEPQGGWERQNQILAERSVQPTGNPGVNQELATEAMPAYKARLAEAIRNIPGATLAASRDAKNPIRLKGKKSRGRDSRPRP